MANNSILLSPLTDMSCDVLDPPQKKVVIKQVDIAYGKKDDVLDLVQKKGAIQPAPLLQQSLQPSAAPPLGSRSSLYSCIYGLGKWC